MSQRGDQLLSLVVVVTKKGERVVHSVSHESIVSRGSTLPLVI